MAAIQVAVKKAYNKELIGWVDPRNVPYGEGATIIVNHKKYSFVKRTWSYGVMSVLVKRLAPSKTERRQENGR